MLESAPPGVGTRDSASSVHQFDYHLPAELIAQTPAEPRDSSRLLVVPPDGPFEDRLFADLPSYLHPGDLLVVNDSRVIPARLVGERESGGKVELLLLRRHAPGHWECLGRPARRLRPGVALRFRDVPARVLARDSSGILEVSFSTAADPDGTVLGLGSVPLPPYIRRWTGDPERYQTVYATRSGSVAAPTAGLHFTPALMERVRERGVDVACLTLHVGVGSFRPMTGATLADHTIHPEWCELSADAASQINRTRKLGGRVVAVGTTTVRTLETASLRSGGETLQPFAGWTDLFITPGLRFRVVDALTTNFHLPRSTLLVLVTAFAGAERVRQVYSHAIDRRYRFYSFGDAMLLYRSCAR